jgi:SlyX protein
MSTLAPLEARLVDLELRFMKLERFVHDLSDTIAAQGRTIDALTLEMRRMRERSADQEREPGNEAPPHY